MKKCAHNSVLNLKLLPNLLWIRSVTAHKLLFYFSDRNAVSLGVEPSYVFEPFLCFYEVLTVLSSCSVYLHLVCVVRLHPRMCFRNMATKRNCSFESERAVAAFEFWLRCLLLYVLSSSLFLDFGWGFRGRTPFLEIPSFLRSLLWLFLSNNFFGRQVYGVLVVFWIFDRFSLLIILHRLINYSHAISKIL